MRYLWALALTLGVLGFATPTFAQTGTCSSREATTLTDANCTDAHWDLDAGVGPCCDVGNLADPTNLYVIDHQVTIDDDLTFTTGGLDPTAGGLVFEPTGGNFTIDLNDGDVEFDAVANIPTFNLALRAFNDSGDVTSDATDPNNWWTVPEVILCPGRTAGEWVEDCGGAEGTPGSVNQIMFLWRATVYDVDASVAAVEVGDLIQFYWNPDIMPPGPRGVSYEHAHMYEIVATSGAGDANGDDYIIIDVRQTNTASPDTGDAQWPPASRAIFPIATAAAATKGQRLGIELVADAYLGSDALAHDARPGVCMYPTGNITEQGLHKPALVSGFQNDHDGGGAGTDDMVHIAPIDGLGADIASGADVFFTPACIKPGDRFLVIAPTRFYSSSASVTDAYIRFDAGPLTIQGALFDKIGHVTTQMALTGDDDGDPDVIVNHVWIRDVWGAPSDGMIGQSSGWDPPSSGASYDMEVNYLCITGGRENATCNTGCHGIQHFDFADFSGNAYINDYATRYLDDDNYFCKGAPTNQVCRVWARRWNLGPMADEDFSSTMSIIEGGGTGIGLACTDCPTTNIIDVEGALCRNCQDDSGNEGFASHSGTGGYVNVRQATWINSRQSGWWPARCGNTSIPGCFSRDLYAVGMRGSGLWFVSGSNEHPSRIDGFVIRDSWGALGTLSAQLATPRFVDIRNGIVHLLTCGGGNMGSTFGNQTTGTFNLHNVLFRYTHLPNDECASTQVTGCWRWNPNNADFIQNFSRLTFTSDTHDTAVGPCTAVWESDDPSDFSGMTIDSIAWVYNHVANSDAFECTNGIDLTANYEGNQCFYNNVGGNGRDGTQKHYTQATSKTITQDLPMDLVYPDHPSRGSYTAPGFPNYAPVPGGLADRRQCGILGGAQGPGVRTDGWYLWAAGLKPLYQGTPGGHEENAW